MTRISLSCKIKKGFSEMEVQMNMKTKRKKS